MDGNVGKIYAAKDVYITYFLAVIPGILFILIGIFNAPVMFAGIIVFIVGFSLAIGYIIFIHSIRLTLGENSITYKTAILSLQQISYDDIARIFLSRTGKQEDYSHEFVIYGKTSFMAAPFIIKLKYFNKNHIEEIAQTLITKCPTAIIDTRINAIGEGNLVVIHEK